jgi:hypothetical protein
MQRSSERSVQKSSEELGYPACSARASHGPDVFTLTLNRTGTTRSFPTLGLDDLRTKYVPPILKQRYLTGLETLRVYVWLDSEE